MGVDRHELGPWRLLAGELIGRIPKPRIERALSQGAESPIADLIAVGAFVEPAHARDVACIDEDVARRRIDRDAAVIRPALLAGEDHPEFLARIRRVGAAAVDSAGLCRAVPAGLLRVTIAPCAPPP